MMTDWSIMCMPAVICGGRPLLGRGEVTPTAVIAYWMTGAPVAGGKCLVFFLLFFFKRSY